MTVSCSSRQSGTMDAESSISSRVSKRRRIARRSSVEDERCSGRPPCPGVGLTVAARCSPSAGADERGGWYEARCVAERAGADAAGGAGALVKKV